MKVFYNCRYKGEDIPDELRKLYDYVENGNAGDELTKRIDEAVAKGRTNAVWRTQYMKERVLLMDAREEGREEGLRLADRTRIEDMLRRGKTVDEIVDFCGYAQDLVESIEKEMLAVAE
ncbi:MAG: hypothetical protein IK111_09980 [Lachnospiraceae bacterium]|nr:hypothetical protein [Lachnospiraceae bacterium]